MQGSATSAGIFVIHEMTRIIRKCPNPAFIIHKFYPYRALSIHKTANSPYRALIICVSPYRVLIIHVDADYPLDDKNYHKNT